MDIDIQKSSWPDIIEAVNDLDRAHESDSGKFIIDLHGNCTVDQFAPAIKAAFYQRNIAPFIRQGDYDNYLQELSSSPTGLGAREPDLGLVILHSENLCVIDTAGDIDQPLTEERLEMLLGFLVDRKYPVAVTNLSWPFFSSNFDSRRNELFIQELNLKIAQAVASSPSLWMIDLHMYAASIGNANAFDRRSWFRYKAPYSLDLIRSVSGAIGHIGSDLRGQSKKCLILDCDNTIWGGIVGEDGPENIKLDAHSYPGNVFYKFQQQIKALEKRGVMIALASKNNEEDVLEVLNAHPHCLLAPDDLVGYRINWDNKPSNVADLIQSLDIGLDSVVFIDDNDVECELMRQALPTVTTIQVPKKLSDLPSILPAANLFSPRPPTREDTSRTRMYREAASRNKAGKQFNSIDDFLGSLDIVANIDRANQANIPRISQLFARTNQFMLTAYRPSEAEISELANRDDAFVYALRSSDKFGDLGIIGALILNKADDAITVKSFALSCRGLGRKLEDVFFDVAVKHAANASGAQAIHSYYQRSKKNAQVSDLYDRYGLTKDAESDGSTQYRGQIDDIAIEVPSFIKVASNV